MPVFPKSDEFLRIRSNQQEAIPRLLNSPAHYKLTHRPFAYTVHHVLLVSITGPSKRLTADTPSIMAKRGIEASLQPPTGKR